MNRSYSYHLRSNSNSAIATVARDINEIIYYVIVPTFQLIASISISLIIFVTLSLVNFSITFISLITITIIYLLFLKFTFLKIINVSKINLKLNQTLVKLVQESIGGIREIILSNNQNYFIKAFLIRNVP